MRSRHDETSARFSQVYLLTPEMLSDSERARVRVALLLNKMPANILADQIGHQLGVRVHGNAFGWNVQGFVETCELRDFLDLFSVVATCVDKRLMEGNIRDFITASQKIFREERLRYVINDQGGVRFSADAVFEAHAQATIKHLGRPEFKAAAVSYDACLKGMAGAPPDCKAAVRHVFEAVEILFKMLHPGVPRIGKNEIENNLVPLLKGSALEATAKNASSRLAYSLAEWVNAAHNYRHGQASQEPVQPPFSLAVLLVDQGATFIRWLAELNVGGTQ
jgi:hypothetical protein